MRCLACNRVLTDYEATRRNMSTGDFLDLCNKCVVGLDIQTTDRPDLRTKPEVFEDDVDDFCFDDSLNEEDYDLS